MRVRVPPFAPCPPRRLESVLGSAIRWIVAIFLAMALVMVAGCEKPPGFDQGAAREAIESSEAFTGSWDPQIRFDGTSLQRQPAWAREILKVEAVQVMGTGLTAVARVRFTWRWNAGPFEGSSFESTAIFIHHADGWRLQEEKLRHELWKQERRAE